MATGSVAQACLRALATACALLAPAGCSQPGGEPSNWTLFAPPQRPAGDVAPPVGAPPAPSYEPRANPGVLVVSALHVRVPEENLQQVEPIWNHMYEQVLDGQTLLTLRQNGIRVAVGHERFWEAVRSVLDAVEGRRVNEYEPLLVPRGYPLLLELDDHPHPQTLFVFDRSGTLSGATLPAGRNRLRLTCALVSREKPRAQVFVVPEVGQRREKAFWLEAGDGAGGAREKCTTFGACGVSVGLGEGEFLVLAPADARRNDSLVGGAFLTDEIDGNRYHSFIFVRPEFTRVVARNQQ